MYIYRTWIEKAVLTKCGILTGYLYRPLYEKAFTPTREHEFTEFDVALNMTEEYYSFYLILICGLTFLCLLIKSLFKFKSLFIKYNLF